MAQFLMHGKNYEIKTFGDLAMVRATLEELHRAKRIIDQEYKIISKRLDDFPKNHPLKK